MCFRTLALVMMWPCCALAAQWNSCAGPTAAFDIQAVDLQPEVIPPGGTLHLVVDVLNKQPAVTAGTATVKVYYYGWWVLTASGGMCEAPQPLPTTAVHSSKPHRVSRDLSTLNWRTLLKQGSELLPQEWLCRRGLGDKPAGRQQLSNGHGNVLSDFWRHAQRASLYDDTCVMPQGPRQLHHEALLPALAPRGNYRMQLSAMDAVTGQELLCLDVWFRVAS